MQYNLFRASSIKTNIDSFYNFKTKNPFLQYLIFLLIFCVIFLAISKQGLPNGNYTPVDNLLLLSKVSLIVYNAITSLFVIFVPQFNSEAVNSTTTAYTLPDWYTPSFGNSSGCSLRIVCN
jgi:hypothetical protein